MPSIHIIAARIAVPTIEITIEPMQPGYFQLPNLGGPSPMIEPPCHCHCSDHGQQQQLSNGEAEHGGAANFAYLTFNGRRPLVAEFRFEWKAAVTAG